MALGLIFMSQTAAGILANFSLLYHYVSLCFTGWRLRRTDLVAWHLTVANALVMLSKGVPQTVAAFGVKYFSEGVGCILHLYIYRVARGVSISTICLLSVFQMVMISPMNSAWKDLKVKLSKHIGLSAFLCWILYMLVNCVFPLYTISKRGSINITEKKDGVYCSGIRDKISDFLYTTFLLFPEVSCSGLMIWSSISMVLILYRHKQQVQHIRGTNISSASSPESKATHSILALVCTFVSFYTLSSFFYACIATFNVSSLWVVNISALISTCFPTVSPFVLMSREAVVCRLWVKFLDFIRCMKSPQV
ncbi:vomeronasal type-1 receptor 4-like [Ctenodactylus gundi]